MATRTIVGTKVQDDETFTLTATVLQEDGTTPVDLTDSNTDAFISFYRDDTKAAINSRNNQQVITAGVASNQHTGSAAGVLSWKSATADSNLGLSADVNVVARYTVTYNDGAAVARTAIQEIQFVVEPLDTVV